MIIIKKYLSQYTKLSYKTKYHIVLRYNCGINVSYMVVISHMHHIVLNNYVKFQE